MNELFYNIAKLFKLIPLETLKNISKQHTILPFYHIVSDAEVVHVKHLYKAKSAALFERELDFLLKHYSPIDIKTFYHNLTNDNGLNKNTFVLSFDDGLCEFYDVVAPILQRKGIPAVCFLNADFIDNRALFFRYKASILVDSLTNQSLSATKMEAISNWCREKYGLPIRATKFCMSIKYENRSLLDELATLMEVDFDQYLKENKPYLTSIQIKELIDQGFSFGAHSLDHPFYGDLSPTQQLWQTETSIAEIASKFPSELKLFSFPFSDFGVGATFFDNVFSTKAPIADLTFGCAGLKNESINLHIQRIPMEFDNFDGKEIIYGQYLYYIAKMFFNKNSIKRD